MLKTFIADDDKILRMGIKTIIRKNILDCEIVGEASNGSQALEFILEHEVDILITDIKMPVMDGVELVKKISVAKPNVKSIVISGFDEYKYVRETLKHGAVDYLLKPVENTILIELISNIREAAEKQKMEIQQINNVSEKIAESLTILKERTLLKLIKGYIYDTAIEKNLLNEYGFSGMKTYWFSAIGLDTNQINYQNGTNNSKILLINILKQAVYSMNLNQQSLGVSMFAASTSEEDLVILFMNKNESDNIFENSVITVLEKLLQTKEAENKIDITVGISSLFYNLDKIHISYWQSMFSLGRKFYEGKNKLIRYIPEYSCYNQINEKKLTEYEELLVNCIDTSDVNKIRIAIRSLLDDLLEMQIEPTQFKSYFASLLHKIGVKLPEFKVALDDLTIKGLDLNKMIMGAGTVDELKDFLMSAFYQIANRISAIRQDRSKKPVEIAKEYIKKHFDEDISLKTVADIVFMNPSYFSELFKNETGKNFIDYLIETRITVAKTYLAKPEIKIYEIGQLVGYNEPVSFNRTFKKVVGVSPLQYRKLIK